MFVVPPKQATSEAATIHSDHASHKHASQSHRGSCGVVPGGCTSPITVDDNIPRKCPPPEADPMDDDEPTQTPAMNAARQAPDHPPPTPEYQGHGYGKNWGVGGEDSRQNGGRQVCRVEWSGVSWVDR